MLQWLRCSGIREDTKYEHLKDSICNKKLMGIDLDGTATIKVKCPRCNAMNEFDYTDNKENTSEKI